MTEALLVGRTPAKLIPQTSPVLSDALFEAERVDEQTFEGVRFEHCTFANVSFKEARLISCTFENCAFIDCYFRMTVLDSSRFMGCKFISCDFPDVGFVLFNLAWAPGFIAGSALAGWMAAAIGYSSAYLVLAILCALTLAVLVVAERRATPLRS